MAELNQLLIVVKDGIIVGQSCGRVDGLEVVIQLQPRSTVGEAAFLPAVHCIGVRALSRPL